MYDNPEKVWDVFYLNPGKSNFSALNEKCMALKRAVSEVTRQATTREMDDEFTRGFVEALRVTVAECCLLGMLDTVDCLLGRGLVWGNIGRVGIEDNY